MCDFDNNDDDNEVVEDTEVLIDPNFKHLSECAISLGYTELGCTCYYDSPEWTI